MKCDLFSILSIKKNSTVNTLDIVGRIVLKWVWYSFPCEEVKCIMTNRSETSRKNFLIKAHEYQFTLSNKTNIFLWHFSCKQYLPIWIRKHFSLCRAVWPDQAIFWTLGNFLKPLATINLSKSPPFLGNFL